MIAQRVADNIGLIRAKRPLIHNVTNLVAMNISANALLSVGASPVMAHAEEELEEIVKIAGSIVLNPGTLDGAWVHSMTVTLNHAKRLSRPVVLDPVGAGASRYRTEMALNLLSQGGVSVLRGNASEVLALSGEAGETKGVDSGDTVDSAVSAAKKLSVKFGCTVVVSGPRDFVVAAKNSPMRQARVQNGDPRMTQVTGLGCTATALIGAALAICPDTFVAAVTGMCISGIAGEIAADKNEGPGSFAVAYLDALATSESQEFVKRLRVDE